MLILAIFQTCHFIRCVKPCSNTNPEQFDIEMVLNQLKSSSTLSYIDFIRLGFPMRIPLEQLEKLYTPHYHLCSDPNQFYTELFLSLGFCLGDFKLGKDHIFFRSNKNELMQKVLLTESSIPMLERYIIDKRNVPSDNHLESISEPESIPDLDHSTSPPIIPAANIIAEVTETAQSEKTRRLNTTRKKTEKKPLNEIRYDTVNHLPDVDNSKNGSRCKNENCEFKTHVFCTKCQVHLCLIKGRNCFKKFHTLNI